MAFVRAIRQNSARCIGALVIAAFLAGIAIADEEMDVGSNFDVDIIDASLNAKLTVLRVGSEPSPNHLLAVFAGLKNKTGHRLDLEVETIYQDESGNDLNAGSWISLTLEAHEEKEYHSTSISQDAVKFLIRVRRATSHH